VVSTIAIAAYQPVQRLAGGADDQLVSRVPLSQTVLPAAELHCLM